MLGEYAVTERKHQNDLSGSDAIEGMRERERRTLGGTASKRYRKLYFGCIHPLSATAVHACPAARQHAPHLLGRGASITSRLQPLQLPPAARS
jgi:hypothetical protein